MEITLSQLQAERNEWVAHNFPDDELVDSIMGAVEELGELAHHYLKWKQGIRGNEAHHYSEMLDAVADCVIFLAGAATHLSVDYGELVTQTWARVKKRDWQENRQEGVPS